MPSVREYFKKKEKRSNNEFKQKLIHHRLTIFYRSALAIAVVVIFGIACYISYENKVYTSYEVISSSTREETENSNYVNYNGHILKYSGDGASAMDINGNVLWNQTFEMQNPKVSTSGSFIALGDHKGNKVYIMDESGLQGEISLRMAVQSFSISSKGIIAIVLDGGDVTWINFYDKTGELMIEVKVTMKNSGYPISISLSEDAKLLGVSHLYVDSGIVRSRLAFYNFGSVGQNKIDNLVCGYDYDNTIIPEVKFINNSTSYALGDNKFVIYEGNQIPIPIKEIDLEDEITGVFHSNKYIGLVFRESGENVKYRLDVYNEKGNLMISEPFNIDYTDIVIDGEQAIIFNSSDCVIYNMKGIQKFNHSFDKSVITILPIGSPTKLVLVSGEATEVIRLRGN